MRFVMSNFYSLLLVSTVVGAATLGSPSFAMNDPNFTPPPPSARMQPPMFNAEPFEEVGGYGGYAAEQELEIEQGYSAGSSLVPNQESVYRDYFIDEFLPAMGDSFRAYNKSTISNEKILEALFGSKEIPDIETATKLFADLAKRKRPYANLWEPPQPKQEWETLLEKYGIDSNFERIKGFNQIELEKVQPNESKKRLSIGGTVDFKDLPFLQEIQAGGGPLKSVDMKKEQQKRAKRALTQDPRANMLQGIRGFGNVSHLNDHLQQRAFQRQHQAKEDAKLITAIQKRRDFTGYDSDGEPESDWGSDNE